MKLFLLSFLALAGGAAVAQPGLVTQAVISTTTNVVAPEDEDVSQIQNQGGGGFNFRNMGDGETKSITYIKNDLVKTSYKAEMGRGITYRNNSTKVTTVIIEMMGNKMGFYTSDNEAADAQKKRDSMNLERSKTDTSLRRRNTRSESFPVTVVYTEETKKIAGFNCKKAWLITDKLIAKDSLAVWYTPEIKFPNVAATGGITGPMNFGASNSFDKIDGFVMQYERSMPRGRRMEVKVTKIETDKEIADKEFDLPKDVEIKSMKEMNEGGGMRMMRTQ